MSTPSSTITFQAYENGGWKTIGKTAGHYLNKEVYHKKNLKVKGLISAHNL